MKTVEAKTISVIIKLDVFAALNGHLPKLSSENEQRLYVEKFFSERYGQGEGRLQILQKKSKAKLTWFGVLNPKSEALHQAALNHAKNKNYREAITNWVNAVAINSKDPDYYFNLGIAFFEIRNYKESIENLKRTLVICPIYHRAHLILGTVYLKTRRFEEAELHLKESINFNPNNGLAYLNLGAVYSILKRYDSGINMFMRVLDLAPNEPRAYFGLGKIYSIKGDIEKANHYFKRVIELDKNSDLANHAKRALQSQPSHSTEQTTPEKIILDASDIENLYQEGYKAFLFTDYDRAIEMYQAYLNKKSEDDFVWFALGEACLRSGQLTKSVDSFQMAIKLNPSKSLYYKELAVAYYYLQKDHEINECVMKAKQLGKSDSILNALQGYSLLKSEKAKEAVLALEEATRMNSNNLFGKLFLAIAYRKIGNNESAMNLLHEIKNSKAKSPLTAEAEALMKP